jgi:putative heme iron utilization protein
MLEDALAQIPEDTPEQVARRAEMEAAEAADALPETYRAQRRWIGALGPAKG